MTWWLWVGVFGGLVVFPGVAHTQARPVQGAPMTEAGRQQIGIVLDQLAERKQALEVVMQPCMDVRRTQQSKNCADADTLYRSYRDTQAQLCQQFNIPSGQHGCP